MAKLEKIETNKVKLTFEISPEQFEKGIQHAYNKNKSKINIQGFRKGKAPRKIIENFYGKAVLYEEAVNFCLPEVYDAAVKEHALDTVSKPEIDVEKIEPNEGVVVTAEVYLKPEVTIADYKGMTYKKMDDTVSEEEILVQLKESQEKNARIITVEDRAVQDQDIVTVDFEGFIDGEAFEGGKGTDYDLNIGSKTFIDTFEEQLIGTKIGDEVEVNVTFPENYGNAALQNKPALFKVTIKGIQYKELPELDDDFAQDVSDFDTLEEYKNSIREAMAENKKTAALQQKENDLVRQLIEKAQLELPEIMVENQAMQMLNDFSNRIKKQGLSMELYLQYVGQTVEDLKASYYEQARIQVLGRLALEAVAKSEQLPVTGEELQKEIQRLADMYRMPVENLVTVLREEDKESLEEDLKVQKALEFIMETAIEEA